MHEVIVTPKHTARMQEEASQIYIPEGNFLLEDTTAGELLAHGWCDVMGPRWYPPPLPNEQGKGIVLIRPGGMGDLLFLTPTIRALKRNWETVAVCCFEKFAPVLEGICLTLPFPGKVEDLSMGRLVVLEDVVERNPLSKTTHIVDLFAAAAGVDLAALPYGEDWTRNENYRLDYAITDAERAEARAMYPRTDAPRLGVQLKASAKCRTFPEESMGQAIRPLWKEGWEMLNFGAPNDYPWPDQERMLNLSNKGLTLRQSIAIAETCDIIIGPDSFYTHLAGALDIPAVGIYSSFPWDLRLGNLVAPKAEAVRQRQKPECAPCHWHARGAAFPDEGACRNAVKAAKEAGLPPHAIRCEALAAIDPASMTKTIREQFEKYGRRG